MLDRTGIKYGRLTALRPSERRAPSSRHVYWYCLCECGNEVEVKGSKLSTGMTKSCGCLVAEVSAETSTTHGRSSKNPEYKGLYQSWADMKQRCLNPNNAAYRKYGGRGVTLCERWETFEGFFEDMSEGWFSGQQLDRIDREGDYTADNCRWIDAVAHGVKSAKEKHGALA